jgi:hypothetical protein
MKGRKGEGEKGRKGEREKGKRGEGKPIRGLASLKARKSKGIRLNRIGF